MKPCRHCGAAVANHLTFCDQCKQKQVVIEFDDLKDVPVRSRHRVTIYYLIVGLLEVLVTTLVVAVPLGVVATLVILFFVPSWWAVVYGFAFGAAAGLLFSLVRGFFVAQSVRKPLQ